MGDKDLYADNVRNYYITSHILFLENGGGMQCCNDSFPDGKTRRRESRRRAIRRRKGRL